LAKNRTKERRKADLSELARMRLEGVSIAECAKALGVSSRTISTDLQKLDALWLEERIGDVERLKTRQEAELQTFKRRTWQSWREGELSAKEALEALLKIWDRLSCLYRLNSIEGDSGPSNIHVTFTTRRKEVQKPS